jgi:Ca-activated chloride channel homolog
MRRTPLIIVAILFMAFCGQVLADGFIIVERHRPNQPEVRTIPLAVKYHRVTVTIKDQVAITEIDQVFINPNPYQLEGTYIFPLPESASISAFSMFIDGKEMPGELLEKDKARKIYQDIVRAMKDPALLEYAGRDMFKASIFPIPARGEKRVKLSYSEICRADGGMVHYRYPLNTEKFSSRPLEDVSVVIDIEGKHPIKNITCPTHPVEVVKKSENQVRVAYEARNVTPDRDLSLYYAISAEDFSMNFLTHRGSPSEDGYFMLLLSPGSKTDKVIAKDVCFVLDTSGSMQGKKMEQAKAALKFCVQALNTGDRFNLVPFSTEARKFSDELLPATKENIGRAVEYVAGMRAAGGTAIDDALTTALRLSPNSDRPYMVVFLTDGLPTIGETKEPVILANVTALNKGNVRLFAFGLGNDVNTHLLDKLAENNRGTRDYVAEEEDLELKVSNFYAKISHPVLSDLDLQFPDTRIHDVYPKRLPDLFKGSQLVVVGRYAEPGSRAVKLTGKVAGETVPIAHDVKLPEKETGNNFLPRLWAIRKIGFLLDEIRLHGETKELKDEIVRLAKLHGVVTPYTSFLVLEDDRLRQTANRPSSGRELDETAGRDRGWGDAGGGRASGGGRGGGSGGRRTPPPADAPDPTSPGAFSGGAGDDREEPTAEKSAELGEGLRSATGGAAVAASKEAKRLKGESLDKDSHGYVPDAGRSLKELMQLIEGVAFYKRGEIWIQADLPKDAKIEKLELFSEAYFKLIEKNPALGLFLALGKVDFVFEGVVFQVR